MPLCASCGQDRTSDQLGECTSCGESICGIGSCTGQCPCAPPLVLSNFEDWLHLNISCADKWYLKDEKGVYVMISELMCLWWGIRAEDVVGKHSSDVHREPSLSRVIEEDEYVKKTMETGYFVQTLYLGGKFRQCFTEKQPIELGGKVWILGKMYPLSTKGDGFVKSRSIVELSNGLSSVTEIRKMS